MTLQSTDETAATMTGTFRGLDILAAATSSCLS